MKPITADILTLYANAMSCSYHQRDSGEKDVPSHGYSSEFVSKAMARLVQPIDPRDPEQYPADMTVRCGSLSVEAHSHVLCQDSSYFRVICKGGFLEEYTRELELPAEEEFLIRRVLCYCYTTGYNDEPYDDEDDPPPQTKAPAHVNRLHLNAQMYGAADKYDMPGLKEKSAAKFDAAVREIHANKGMNQRTGATSLVDEVIEAIPCIYSSTPDQDRRLRDRAVSLVRYQWEEFRDHPRLNGLFVTVPEFFEERGVCEVVCRNTPDVGYDVI